MSRFREELGKQGYRRTGAKKYNNSKGVELEGFEEFLVQVKALGDSMKVQATKGIIKKNLEPVVFAIKANTPIRKSKAYQGTITRKRKNGEVSTKSEVGNLYKSIGSRIFSKGTQITGYVGIQKKKNDGWYGFFIERGTKNIAKNPFIAQAAATAVPLAADKLGEDITGYILTNAKKLGLNAK